MNLHMPQDEESEAEFKNLAAVPYQIISPANNASIVGVFQDSLLGAYRFTRPNIKFDQREAMNLLMAFNKVDTSVLKKNKELTLIFSCCEYREEDSHHQRYKFY